MCSSLLLKYAREELVSLVVVCHNRCPILPCSILIIANNNQHINKYIGQHISTMFALWLQHHLVMKVFGNFLTNTLDNSSHISKSLDTILNTEGKNANHTNEK